MHIAQLAMNLGVNALEAKIASNDKVTDNVLQLVRSPLLQGSALKTLLLYFNTIVKVHPNKYKDTARALTGRVYSGPEPESRNEIHNIARCLAELTISWGNGQKSAIEPVIGQMLTDSEHAQSDCVKQFSLLTLGELGHRTPLGPKVIQHQISQFKASSEDIKVAAALGLGLTAAGNLVEVLPILLNNLNIDDSQGNYLTLLAIKQGNLADEIHII